MFRSILEGCRERRYVGLQGILALGILLCWATGLRAEQAAIVPDEILVRVRNTGDNRELKQAIGRVGTPLHVLSAIGTIHVKLRQGVTQEGAKRVLGQCLEVLSVEPNRTIHLDSTPNDALYANQYGPQNIRADKAWEIWQPLGLVVVAVIDTGIDTNHPDLTNKILRDTLGVVGYNVFLGQRDVGKDDHGHGTHCAGVIGAQSNNGVGIAGIAGWTGLADATDVSHVKLMPIKVIDNKGNGTDEGVAEGVLWAADHGANVLSLSLGSSDYTLALSAAIQYAWDKGCVVVASAGNRGVNSPNYPAGFPISLAVAANDSTDLLASFSNWGDWVQVTGPGVGVYSTLPTYTTSGGLGKNYGNLSGTSMSCPHVAGEAALLMTQNPGLTNRQIKALIMGNVDTYTGHKLAAKGGRVNAFRAVQAAFTPPPPASEKVYLFPMLDAMVVDGTNADTNFGLGSTLEVSHVPAVSTNDQDRVTYLKFDLSTFKVAPDSALLTLTTAGGNVTPLNGIQPLSLYYLGDNTWEEDKITWNNAPGLNTSLLTSTGTLITTQNVTLQTRVKVTFNVTDFVKAHLGEVVTLQLLNSTPDSTRISFNSRESQVNVPQIVLTFPAVTIVSGQVLLESVVDSVQPITFEFRPVGGGTSLLYSQNLTTTGSFRLDYLPPGNYHLAVKGAKWLQKVVAVNTTSGDLTGLTVSLSTGDVNNDNQVNLDDLGLLADAFDTFPGDLLWNVQADLNCDQQVNLDDLGLLALHFDEAGDP